MITYRSPTPEDAPALAALGRESFVDAFGDLYSRADLTAFLDSTYTPEVAAADIADPLRAVRLAEQDGALIGYCKLGFDRSLDFDIELKAMELKQLYLRGAATGAGIGSTLMDWVLAQGRERGFEAVILSVYSGNVGGQRFYRRHGFEKWADTFFMVGEQRDEEFIYGRML